MKIKLELDSLLARDLRDAIDAALDWSQPPRREPPPSPVKLSPHFTLAEFTFSRTAAAHAIENDPGVAVHRELGRLAETMEKIRSLLGAAPITITSGYRSPALNDHPEVGGVADSAHCFGRACDFVAPAFGTPSAICRAIEPHLRDFGIDQLINESNSAAHRWVHVGIAQNGHMARHQCFTIAGGTIHQGIV